MITAVLFLIPVVYIAIWASSYVFVKNYVEQKWIANGDTISYTTLDYRYRETTKTVPKTFLENRKLEGKFNQEVRSKELAIGWGAALWPLALLWLLCFRWIISMFDYTIDSAHKGLVWAAKELANPKGNLPEIEDLDEKE